MKLSVGPVVNILYLMQFGCIYQLTRETELTTLKTGGITMLVCQGYR